MVESPFPLTIRQAKFWTACNCSRAVTPNSEAIEQFTKKNVFIIVVRDCLAKECLELA